MFIRTTIVLFFSVFFFISCNKDDDGDVKICFYGDSMVANWDVVFSFPNRITENRGVDGIGIAQLKKQNIQMPQSLVVVLIGTNDLVAGMTDKQLKDYCSLFEQTIMEIVSKRTIIVSVLPTGDLGKNVVIRNFNQMMDKKLSSSAIMTFVNCYDVFVDNGVLRKEFERDGIHLNDYGYRVLTDKVREAI